MRSSTSSLITLFSFSLIVATGCSKKESSASATTPSEPAVATAPKAEMSPATPVETTLSAAASLTAITVPDLQSSSVAQLAQISTTSLTNLTALAGPSHPEVAAQVAAVKSSLDSNRAVDALDQLKQLTVYAQSIPGAAAAIDTAKLMVSGWALKQGFDPAKIGPILGALQQRDYTALASQAAMLAGAGGLTAEQTTLINGVLSTYGIDAKIDDVLGKVKGLFNR